MSSSPSTRPMSRSPARDGLLQSTVPHPRRANSSAAGLRTGSTACCSHFLGSCRELTVHDFFCKTQIWKVSSQLQNEACGTRPHPPWRRALTRGGPELAIFWFHREQEVACLVLEAHPKQTVVGKADHGGQRHRRWPGHRLLLKRPDLNCQLFPRRVGS